MKRRSEFKSWLGFINYHIFWTGYAFTRIMIDNQKSILRLRKISSILDGMTKEEIWIEDKA